MFHSPRYSEDPQANKALQIILISLAINAVSERSFSKLKLLKNNLRASCGDVRLSHLMTCSIILRIYRYPTKLKYWQIDLLQTFQTESLLSVSLLKNLFNRHNFKFHYPFLVA